MHFEADLTNEINRAQSAGKINDAKMHFNLVLFPLGCHNITFYCCDASLVILIPASVDKARKILPLMISKA